MASPEPPPDDAGDARTDEREQPQRRPAAPPAPRDVVPDPQDAAADEPEAPADAFSEADHWVDKDDSDGGSG